MKPFVELLIYSVDSRPSGTVFAVPSVFRKLGPVHQIRIH